MPREAIIESAGSALKNIKKLIASGGKLQGNFYFASDRKGETAAIVVTMTAKDPRGEKAATEGKKLRSELKAAKFARGLVRVDGSKVCFELHGGSATADLMKRSFKNGFEDDELKALKSVLRKARFDSPDEEGEAADEDASVTEEDRAVTEEEGRELDELRELQGDLERHNQALREGFLSQEAIARDRQERVKALSDEIQRLSADAEGNAGPLQEARYQLAEELHTGSDPFPEVGGTLPEDVTQLLLAVTTTFDGLLALAEAARDYRAALAEVEKQLTALGSELKKQEDAPLLIIGRSGLARLLGMGRDPLQAAITAAEKAAPDQRPGKLREVGQKATAFLKHLADHPAVDAVDRNPFGVSVSVKKTLSPSLQRLAAAASI